MRCGFPKSLNKYQASTCASTQAFGYSSTFSQTPTLSLPSKMQTVTLISACVLVVALLLTAPPTADAACCHATFGFNTCRDCTDATPYCGYGPCNLFGCACSGGCRTGNCNKKREAGEEDESFTAEHIVRAGDLNGDGLLSIDEAETLLQQRSDYGVHRRSVRSLDKNMDGMLTVDEIDH